MHKRDAIVTGLWFFVAVLTVLPTWVCRADPAPPSDADLQGASVINPFELGRGINSPEPYHAENIDKTTMNEFLAYDRAFSPVGHLLQFAVPGEDPPTNYRYAGIGPFPIHAGHRYALAFQAARRIYPTDQFTTMFLATYLHDGKSVRFDNLYGTREAQINMPRIEQEFPVPPDADAMILWIGVSNSPNRLTAGPKVLFQSLQLLDRGPLNGTAANQALRGQNLLPVSDFADQPLGPYAPDRQVFYCGPRNQGEIVQQDVKCLHIVRPVGGYLYPYFCSRPADLENCGVEFTCRVKGKGSFDPMIWWMTKESSWNYYGGRSVVLTDAWQTVRLWRGCINADLDYAACSLAAQSPETDMYVTDLSLRIIPPPQ
jgi:hypothetical protein